MSSQAPTTMLAQHTTKYGAPSSVLSLQTVPVPSLSPTQILVRVISASTHAGDWHLIRGTPFFIRFLFGTPTKPTIHIPGSDFAGVVQAVGTDVTQFKPGDRVFGESSENGFGAFAEYISIPETAVARIPDGVSMSDMACVPSSGLAALQALRDYGEVKKGMRVLVNGASGGVGSFAVQIAKKMGANVTAIARGNKVQDVEKWGADDVVDSGKEDVTEGKRGKWDVIIDAAVYRNVRDWMKVVEDRGKYVMIGGEDSRFFGMLLASAWYGLTSKKKAYFVASKGNQSDLEELARMMQEEDGVKARVWNTFPLEKVTDAIACLEERKVCGKIAIEVGQEE